MTQGDSPSRPLLIPHTKAERSVSMGFLQVRLLGQLQSDASCLLLAQVAAVNSKVKNKG